MTKNEILLAQRIGATVKDREGNFYKITRVIGSSNAVRVQRIDLDISTVAMMSELERADWNHKPRKPVSNEPGLGYKSFREQIRNYTIKFSHNGDIEFV